MHLPESEENVPQDATMQDTEEHEEINTEKCESLLLPS